MNNLMRQIPNIISCFRLVLVPIFIWLFFSGNPLWVAGLIYLIAGLSDLLDGHLARKYGWISALGKVLDPLADKLLQLSGFLCLLIAEMIPLWAALAVGVKELAMLLGGSVLLKKQGDVPAANKLGKAASFIFYTTTLIILIVDPPQVIRTILLTVVIILGLCALIGYASNVWKSRPLKKKESQ